MTFKPLHLAILVTAVFGFNFAVIKVGVARVPPLLITGLSLLFAGLPAAFFVAKTPKRASLKPDRPRITETRVIPYYRQTAH